MSEALERPELAARFELGSMLGRGGFAVTYAARERSTGRAVAIKVLSLHTVDHWRAVELFEREVRVLKHLDHPGVPRYVDFVAPGEGEPTWALVQELAPGRSLAARLAEGWRATPDQLVTLARQVLEILVYLHELHPPVLHRDVKPDNLILADDGQVRLVDFGSVRDRLARESQLGSVVGTFGYMA
ncbi:MAG: serine/threonine protein kinase, partial [Myxococcales bacterium]|nr:serine/threonine protein kinase [Myxococcales bacterium]